MISVSVLIPVYNGERFLQESLNSLYNQSFTDFEIVIIDDGSKDDTRKIVESQTDSRVTYYKNNVNIGIIETLNKGIQLCEGKYIARMDADDIAKPERLQLQFDFLEKNLDYVLLGSSIIRFSDQYSILDKRGGDDDDIRAKLLFDTAINHPSAMFRTETVKKNKLTYSMDYIHAEDYGLWVELSKYGKIANLDDVLLKYRMHGGNISMKFNGLQYATMNTIRKMQFHEFWLKAEIPNSVWEQKYAHLSSLQTIDREEILQMDKLLMELIEANGKVQLYNNIYLKKHAAWFWYVVYIHSKCKRYSPLLALKVLKNRRSVFYNLDTVYKTKFLGKCFSFGKI